MREMARLMPLLSLGLLLAACGPVSEPTGNDNANQSGNPDGAVDARSPDPDGRVNNNTNLGNANLNQNLNNANCTFSQGPSGFAGTVPDLAAAADGTVYLSYVAGNEVRLAELGGSSEPVPDSLGPDTRFRKPRIAREAGATHLVWGSSAVALEYARRTGAQWLRETVTTLGAGECFSVPQIAVTPDGTVHVIHQWCRECSTCDTSPTVYWHRPPGGGWTGPALLSDEMAEWRDDALAADSLGRVHAVWKGAHQDGQYQRRSSAGDWLGQVEEIPALVSGDTVSFGDLTVDSSGRAHHAFYEFDDAPAGGCSGIGYAVRDEGSGWSAADLVAGPDLESSDDYDMRPGIAVSPGGTVTITWCQWDPDLGAGGRQGPIMACQGSAGAWTCGPVALDSGVTAGGKPAVVFAGGAFHLVWRHNDGDLHHLEVSCPDY